MADKTEDEAKQRKDRLEQNRISARESRKRKKTMIEELQRTVINLSKENKELNERNESLRRELVEIGTKHPGLVPIQALMRGGPLAAQEEGGAAAPLAGESKDENPQAAAAVTGSQGNQEQQQQLAMMQQMVQMQALANGMGQNPGMMGALNPALMGMMGMGGGGQMQAGQQQQQQQQQQQVENAGQEGQAALSSQENVKTE